MSACKYLTTRKHLQGLRVVRQANSILLVLREAVCVGHALRDVQERLVGQAQHAAGVGTLGVLAATGGTEQNGQAGGVLIVAQRERRWHFVIKFSCTDKFKPTLTHREALYELAGAVDWDILAALGSGTRGGKVAAEDRR